MKKFFCVALCALFVLASCNNNPPESSSDPSSCDVSEISSDVSQVSSEEEASQITSSQEEIFEFAVDAKTAVKRIKDEIPFTADMIELDKHFLHEKTGISEDMYEDFYAQTSYETSDNSFVAVFCCKTADKADKLKQKLEGALLDENKLSYLSSDAKILTSSGCVVFIATQNNFDEENLVSKLIQ